MRKSTYYKYISELFKPPNKLPPRPDTIKARSERVNEGFTRFFNFKRRPVAFEFFKFGVIIFVPFCIIFATSQPRIQHEISKVNNCLNEIYLFLACA